MEYLSILASGFLSNAYEISNSDKFWATLSAHCGKSYEGKLPATY